MEPATAAVAMWLTTTAASDEYTRLRDRLSRKSEARRFCDAVRLTTGIYPGRRYRRWLREPATWKDLVTRNDDAYERLVDSLVDAESKGFFRRRDVDRNRSVRIVQATIQHAIEVLDPSLAVAVADFRSEERHQEMKTIVVAAQSFESRLDSLPPTVRDILGNEKAYRSQAEHLADAVIRGDPRTVIASLILQQPSWLADAPGVILLALAELAEAYGLRIEAAQTFVRVADLGLDRARNYARAGLLYAFDGQEDLMTSSLEAARNSGEYEHLDVIEAGIGEDWAKVIRSIDRESAAGDTIVAGMYSLALQERVGLDDAIAFLREVINRLPEYAGFRIRLAQLLLDRGLRPGATSRDGDLAAALQLAVDARDLRRKWRGSSGDAVTVACHVAHLTGDYRLVLRLGRVPPEGVAWPAEVATPEVQIAVANAAFALGENALASSIAESTASDFHRALVEGEQLVLSKAPQLEIDDHFSQAWALVQTENEKVAFWLSAAGAGTEPLPGQDEIDRREDELPVILSALQHLAHDRAEAAIQLLRPCRQNEFARKILVGAYLSQGEIDRAASELQDMAERFDNPRHLISAVEVLAGSRRLMDAAEIADRALMLVQVGTFGREVLREVGIQAAMERGDWRDVEVRTRAWIDESGADKRRMWPLALALHMQTKSEAAWRVYREAGDPDPETAAEAQLWIVLHAEHAPSVETLSRVLALCDDFPNDPNVRRSAVNSFFLIQPEQGDISETELARWQELVAERAANPGADDTFVSVSVPDDPAELVEALRPLLEPQALRVQEWRSKVRKGMPYGMLAAAAGRPYTAALVQRAAGFLPIASTDFATILAERQAAEEAMDGPVVADLSVLAVAWYIEVRWLQLLGAFARVELPFEALKDAAMAVSTMRLRPVGSLGWDVQRDRPVLEEATSATLAQLEAHLRWVNNTAASLSLCPPASEPAGRDLGPWLTSIAAAKSTGRSLWADDVGLRALARSEGVPTFGTVRLLEVIADKRGQSQLGSGAIIESLRDNYCVDFPLDKGWIKKSASDSDWKPGAALINFTRPSMWRDLPSAFRLWCEIVDRAGKADIENVPAWIYAATVGISGAVTREAVQSLVANLLTVAAEAVKMDPTAFAACFSAVRVATAEEGLPDPTEFVFRELFSQLSRRTNLADAATSLARLGTELPEEDRQVLRRVIFDV